MPELVFKRYENFDKFVTDYIFTAMEEKYAMVIINYKNYQELVNILTSKTINGKNIVMSSDSIDNFDIDIDAAKHNGGNIMVTLYADRCEIFGEPVLYKTINAFAEGVYYADNDAEGAIDLPITGTMIPVEIKKD